MHCVCRSPVRASGLVYAARAPISSKPVSGRLAKYLDAYITLLKNLGYSAVSTRTQIRLIAKFNQWLQWKYAEFCDLDESANERFLQSRHNTSGTRRGDTAALCRFLHMLRQQGATRQSDVRFHRNVKLDRMFRLRSSILPTRTSRSNGRLR